MRLCVCVCVCAIWHNGIWALAHYYFIGVGSRTYGPFCVAYKHSQTHMRVCINGNTNTPPINNRNGCPQESADESGREAQKSAREDGRRQESRQPARSNPPHGCDARTPRPAVKQTHDRRQSADVSKTTIDSCAGSTANRTDSLPSERAARGQPLMLICIPS